MMAGSNNNNNYRYTKVANPTNSSSNSSSSIFTINHKSHGGGTTTMLRRLLRGGRWRPRAQHGIPVLLSSTWKTCTHRCCCRFCPTLLVVVVVVLSLVGGGLVVEWVVLWRSPLVLYAGRDYSSGSRCPWVFKDCILAYQGLQLEGLPLHMQKQPKRFWSSSSTSRTTPADTARTNEKVCFVHVGKTAGTSRYPQPSVLLLYLPASLHCGRTPPLPTTTTSTSVCAF
jgi:hypothetical protein